MGMEQKLAHLRMIQAVITRMAPNSFQTKGWSIILVAALFALAAAGTGVVADLVQAGREDELHGHLPQSADDQSASAGRLQLGGNRRPTGPGARPVTELVVPVTQTYSDVNATTTHSIGLPWRALSASGNAYPLRIRAGTAAIRSRPNG